MRNGRFIDASLLSLNIFILFQTAGSRPNVMVRCH